MSGDTLFYDEIERHAHALAAVRDSLSEPFSALVAVCRKSLDNGGKLMFFGNGGSAADAQHLATELTIRYMRNRKAIAALALTTDTSCLTACANDLGFELIFARQIEALARPGDVAIGITTSGNSANVTLALEAAKAMGCVAAGLSGRDGGKLVGLADPLLIVPVHETARIQEMHILIGHMLCEALEREALS
ncbi:MAG: D-sedoheptulose 7-phosphate isomerase [Alphaproteobacteria bacterium]|nr:D-sedoheptulose 7-phosphate isomerase [Alphaproteobacteria bacterium]